ncbi:curli-like amyloid fiber formation chaperone CsgH [Allorhizobium sp. NPDC080224]|uniref:curli-like amyloid fiber formation chaperone CsgH n=1 Tax=Allorhizobium sp. NPDC080224 TaxID=3390547 RepID=UPI003D082CFB
MANAGPIPSSRLCEIKVTPQAGRVSLEAVARAERSLSGTYTLRIEQTGGSGNSSISQGGAFEVSADQDTSLASVTLASRGSRYQAVLEVAIGGRSDRCTERVRVP